MKLQILFLPVILFALLFNSCQSENSISDKKQNIIDSVEYAIVSRSKEIGNCSISNSQCAKIHIQTLDIKSGITDEKAINIELDLINEILTMEGSEVSTANNIDEFIDLLLDEYNNLINTIKDYYLPWEVNYTINVLNNTAGLLTVQINSYSYRGGAHGTEYIKYVNYSLHDGSKINIDSAFNISKDFIKLCENSFRKKFNLDPNSSLYESGFYFGSDNFYIPDNYYIKGEVLHLIYNTYEIAPYNEGIIDLEIPIASILPYIKSKVIKDFTKKVTSSY